MDGLIGPIPEYMETLNFDIDSFINIRDQVLLKSNTGSKIIYTTSNDEYAFHLKSNISHPSIFHISKSIHSAYNDSSDISAVSNQDIIASGKHLASIQY